MSLYYSKLLTDAGVRVAKMAIVTAAAVGDMVAVCVCVRVDVSCRPVTDNLCVYEHHINV